MKREVAPITVVIGILLALTVVQVLYWRGLITHPVPHEAAGRGAAGGSAGATGPRGLPGATITTIAGAPEAGYRDGPAAQALFDSPAGVAVDRAGTVYLADSRNHCVRVVEPGGRVSTLAGNERKPGYADGPAAQARFSAPAGVAVAPNGTLLVSDTGNHRIRGVTSSGVVFTYAGAETPRDDLGREVGAFRDGPASEAQFRYPVGIAVDESGAVYVADAGNHRVRRISPDGEVSTLAIEGATEMASPTELALSADNYIWVADTAGGSLWTGPRQEPLREWRPSGDQGSLIAPAGIAVLAQTAPGAEVYVLDAGDHCLWRIDGDRLTLVAGQPDAGAAGWADGPGYEAEFSCPAGIAGGPEGELYVADFGNNCLRRITLTRNDREAH